MNASTRHRQTGVALVVGLIMLVMMTLIAVVSYKLAKTSLDIVGNTQTTNEALTSANSTVEEVLSTTRMFENPAIVFLDPCNGVSNTRCYDINRDGTDDITVALNPQPTCLRWQDVLSAALNLNDGNQAACATGTPQGVFGVSGAATGNSLCADSLWEINAAAADNVTSTSTRVVVGAGVRVPRDDVLTTCPLLGGP